MQRISTAELIGPIAERAHKMTGAPADYDWLLERIGDKRLVLLGEASHGTHEFYRERIRISQRLIEEKGFMAVAVEADWPDAYRVNRFVRGVGEDGESVDALAGFKRFPTWMWRNADVLDFVGWLRTHNESAPSRRVGFYGLDLYSLHASIAAVLEYLGKVDPEAAVRARQRYACFDHFGGDVQQYAYRTALGLSASCEREAVSQLVDLQAKTAAYAARGAGVEEDEFFYAEQNARLVRSAELYYRTMFAERADSWNLRDRHMVETLEALLSHLDRGGKTTKIIVWEHNSHIGDARATRMGAAGELNVGQLVREAHGDDTYLVGFTTHEGTVTAATGWDGPAERKRVRPSLEGSYESVFHRVSIPSFGLDLRDEKLRDILRSPRLERAIGVIYRPQTERHSHYFEAQIAGQFDAVIHLDATRAVEPLERTGLWSTAEPPETFPYAV
jgi:erythromycin esterase-like protein